MQVTLAVYSKQKSLGPTTYIDAWRASPHVGQNLTSRQYHTCIQYSTNRAYRYIYTSITIGSPSSRLSPIGGHQHNLSISYQQSYAAEYSTKLSNYDCPAETYFRKPNITPSMLVAKPSTRSNTSKTCYTFLFILSQRQYLKFYHVKWARLNMLTKP